MTLDEFLDESVRRSAAVGYHPTKFIGMRDEARKRGKSVVSVIKSLVESSEPRSGYVRLVQLGLTEWSLESAVLKYPQEFERRTIAFAEARRNGTLDASKPKRA